MTDRELIAGMIDTAREAQKEYEKFSQEQVDAIVRAAGKAIFDHSEELAKMDYEETGMGTYESKVAMQSNRAKAFWFHMRGKKSRGILRRIEEEGIIEIAKPMGVIGSITPVTSAVIAPMHNIMAALKCGNAVIVGPHPRSKKTSARVVELMQNAIEKLGAPKDLIQIVKEPTIQLSTLIMELCDVCISTGGPGVVKAAYTSGKPAYGVGAGNVQCLVDRGVDMKAVVPKIIAARMHNQGIPCSCEQFAHIPEEQFDEYMEEFKAAGCYYIDDEELTDKVRGTLFPDGEINKEIVGRPPYEIAKAFGMEIPEETKIIVVKVSAYGHDEILAKEKLFPVLAVRAYKTWEEAVDVAEANLTVMGKGHSTTFHSNDNAHIEYAAEKISVSRFAINQSSTAVVGGTMRNGLAPTGTLGCGSWGNNSISENLDYKHLYNISRVVFEPENNEDPTDEEVWGE